MKRAALQEKWARQKSPKRVRKPASALRAASLNRAELKSFDTGIDFTFDDTGEVPAGGQLCLVQAGDAFNNRDGALIQIKSVQVRGTLNAAYGAATSGNATPVMFLVLDRQCNGAAAAVTDVMNSASLGKALPYVPNQYRFKILRRIVFDMNSTAGVSGAMNNTQKWVDEYVSFKKPLLCRFTASTGAITDVTGANIFLLAGTGLPGQDDIVSFSGYGRIRFTG